MLTLHLLMLPISVKPYTCKSVRLPGAFWLFFLLLHQVDLVCHSCLQEKIEYQNTPLSRVTWIGSDSWDQKSDIKGAVQFFIAITRTATSIARILMWRYMVHACLVGPRNIPARFQLPIASNSWESHGETDDCFDDHVMTMFASVVFSASFSNARAWALEFRTGTMKSRELSKDSLSEIVSVWAQMPRDVQRSEWSEPAAVSWVCTSSTKFWHGFELGNTEESAHFMP